MRILECTFTVGSGGVLKIPASVMQKMGLLPGDHVRIAYLTRDGQQNLFQEFFLSANPLDELAEDNQIKVPTHILEDANIPADADLQILCLNIPIYKCYNRTQHKELCDGPTTYRAERVDQVVESLLRGIFERAKSVDEQSFVKQQVQVSSQQYQQKLRKAKADYTKAAKELSKWEGLMLDSIEGTCVFTPEQIKKRMDTVQTTLDGLTQQISDLQEQATASAALANELQEQHKRLLSWADMFDSASPQEKKMVASYIIKAVTLTRNYGIQVEFNISEAQYLGGMEMG